MKEGEGLKDQVLSQNEIDQLLGALASGQLQPGDVKAEREQSRLKSYDFRRPNKFSQEQLRTLYLMHENFGRLTSNFLSAYLRTGVHMKMTSVDQLTYEDFVVSIPTPTLLTVVTLEPLPGMMVMEENSAFSFPLVDLLFGGEGRMLPRTRELTEIEQSVLRNLNAKILEQLAFAWADIYQIRPKIGSLETNPQLTQVISPNETVAVITIETAINGSNGLLNICLPYMTLEQVLPRLSARHWFRSAEGAAVEGLWRRLLEQRLGHISVELALLAGNSEISVGDFLQLGVGDVIPLDRLIKEDMELTVQRKIKFRAQVGTSGRYLAAQVTAMAEGVRHS